VQSCNPKCIVRPTATKVHDIKYITASDSSPILALSTESGQIQFYKTGTTPQFLGALTSPDPASRIKSFEILDTPGSATIKLAVGASSDGIIRIWTFTLKELVPETKKQSIGKVLGQLQTDRRLLCLGAFVLDGEAKDGPASDQSEDEAEAEEEDDQEDTDDQEDEGEKDDEDDKVEEDGKDDEDDFSGFD
jgi:hypothetical protein